MWLAHPSFLQRLLGRGTQGVGSTPDGPDGLVVRGTEELTAVTGETHGGDSLGVGPLEATQTLSRLELPHLHNTREAMDIHM